MIHRVWRRCPDCGHLWLAPFGHDEPCPCRQPRPDDPQSSSLDWLTPRPPQRIDPSDDVARRLLERAFPDGLDF
ncbi:MAG TPA: hypothetical protein VFU81_20285 [Thermomicrobiales bacterium]|nr:hypothetical protein [Thermomicrobiales bacterium]